MSFTPPGVQQIVNNDITTAKEGLSSSGTRFLGKNLLQQAIDYLIRKFRGVYHWITGIREDGSIFKVPATARGNQTYAFYQQARIKQIQEYLKKEIRIADNTTNALFITLTQKYEKEEIEKIGKTWYNTKLALRKFKTKLRKLGMKNYVMTIEAHEAGGCHAHMIAIFNDRIKIHATKENRYRMNDIELLYKIKKAWASSLGYDMDSAFVDIVACGNHNLIGYITKELKKASSCEKAIKNIEKENDTPSDRKKVLAFYFADKYKMRLLYVSKGICAAEPEENVIPETDLINNVISESPKGKRVLYICVIKKSELLKRIEYSEISPYTGSVDEGTQEYDALMGIFEEKYKILEILSNKRETERVIAEHQERILTKKNTKKIAEKAIDE
jgi:hypothetical protein